MRGHRSEQLGDLTQIGAIAKDGTVAGDDDAGLEPIDRCENIDPGVGNRVVGIGNGTDDEVADRGDSLHGEPGDQVARGVPTTDRGQALAPSSARLYEVEGLAQAESVNALKKLDRVATAASGATDP